MDTDFGHAIQCVEDFGCRTAVVGICEDVPDRLKENCDESFTITAEDFVKGNLVKKK